MIQNLMTGATGITAELSVVKMVKASVTFGNIGCRRSRGPKELISHAIPFFLWKLWKDIAGDE